MIGLKFSKQEIIQANNDISFDDTITFEKQDFAKMQGLKDLKPVNVAGNLHYDQQTDLVTAHFDIDGVMITPCAITNEDVEYPFETSGDVVYSFHKVDKENDDIIEVKKDTIELLPQIFQLIILEVPLKIVKPGLKEYPKGDGWEVITEEDLAKEKEQKIDPRMAKLAEFKFEDDK